MFAKILLLFLVANGVFWNANGKPLDDSLLSLDDLCRSNTNHDLSVGQLSLFAKQLGQSDADCPRHIKTALIDLARIISDHDEDICSAENAQAIVAFYNSHMKNKTSGEIPGALERFALTYAMRTSQACKINMISVLTHDANRKPSVAFPKLLCDYTGPNGDIAQLLTIFKEPGAFVLPNDLVSIFSYGGKQIVAGSSSKVTQNLELLKHSCAKHLRPIYKPLVEPVAILARSGMDYPDASIREELGESFKEVADDLESWARVVFLCEALDLVRPAEQEADERIVFEEGDAQSVREDAQKVNVSSRIVLDEVIPLPPELYNQLVEDLGKQKTNPDHYRTRLVENKNEIWNRLAGGNSEVDSKESPPSKRKLMGSSKQEKSINWAPLLRKIVIATVIAAALIKVPLQ